MHCDKNNLYHQFAEMYLELVKPEPARLMTTKLVNNVRSMPNKKDAEDRWEAWLVIMPKSLLLNIPLTTSTNYSLDILC